MNVAASMPPNTPVPIERRAAAPGADREHERQHAQHEGERGHHDRPEAQPRRLEARRRAGDRPFACSCAANSTIRIAFFAARPISTTQPDLEIHVVADSCAANTAASAPSSANGTASSTATGSDQRS